MSDPAMRLSVEWEPARGVSSAELGATWCRFEATVEGRSITTVEDRRTSTVRRGVYTSAYPLAEWIAEHWWLLITDLRPSTAPRSAWTWRQVALQPWLRSHNLRAAGGGMPWPDLTLVPEGSLTRVVWAASGVSELGPVSYLTSGEAHLPAASVLNALSAFVDVVVVRLEDAGVTGTRLQQEWQLLEETDLDEAAFAVAAARLGLDPYDVSDEVVEDIVALAEVLEPDLLAELLNSAQPDGLRAAQSWIEQARSVAVTTPRPPARDLAAFTGTAAHRSAALPWMFGYEGARAYRRELGLAREQPLAVHEHVGTTFVERAAGGLQGLVVAPGEDQVGVVLPSERALASTSVRFAQARALGASLLTERSLVLLDPTATDLARTVRAFAAEILAPAEGLRAYFAEARDSTPAAFEALARHYGVSPLLVQHQYENQVIAGAS